MPQQKKPDTPERVYNRVKNRERYLRAVNTGICVYCHKTPVENRSYCGECSYKQAVRTYRSGLRFYLTSIGIDWKTAEKLTPEEGRALLELAKGNK